MVSGYAKAQREPVISPGEERALIAGWQERRCRSSIDKLLRSHARIAFAAARRWTSDPVKVDDLAQDGMIGIWRAAGVYREERGVRFAVYCRYWVRSCVAAAVPQVLSVVDVPSRLWLDVASGKIAGRRREVLLALMRGSVSLDAPADGFPGATNGDVIPSGALCPEEIVHGIFLGRKLQTSLVRVLGDMPGEDAEVFRRRRLKDDPDTFEQIGADMSVTKERVRQMEARAVSSVRSALLREGYGHGIAA